MGNCFSEESPGGAQAVGSGGIAGEGGGVSDAVNLFLKSRGAPFSQIEVWFRPSLFKVNEIQVLPFLGWMELVQSGVSGGVAWIVL